MLEKYRSDNEDWFTRHFNRCEMCHDGRVLECVHLIILEFYLRTIQ